MWCVSCYTRTFIEGALEEKRSQYLTAVALVGESYGIASLDLSTGQFLVTELDSFTKSGR